MEKFLKAPYVPLVLLATLVWFGGSTYWYVCETQGLCGDDDKVSVQQNLSHSHSDGTNHSHTADYSGHQHLKTGQHEHESEGLNHDHEYEDSGHSHRHNHPDTEVDHSHEYDDIDHSHDDDANASDEVSVDSSAPVEMPGEVTVLFLPDQDVAINEAWKSEVDAVIAYAQENNDSNVNIVGYAANISSDVGEDDLSIRRAQSVANYITNAGIDAERVSVSAEVHNNPIGDNSTEEGRAQNRRATVTIN